MPVLHVIQPGWCTDTFLQPGDIENDIDIEARLNLTVLRPRCVYQFHVLCSDDRKMGG